MKTFSHYKDDGSSRMVDISDKKVSSRTARAVGFVRIQDKVLDQIEKRLLPKGNVFEVSRIAGILGAKKTAELIPMCHSLILSHVDLNIYIDKKRGGIALESFIRLDGRTGAEMEALTAVSIASLTIYDMCKAVDKTMVIEDVRLVEKKGGKSDIKLAK